MYYMKIIQKYKDDDYDVVVKGEEMCGGEKF